MTTATAPPVPRFSVDQYHRMIAAGVLTEGDGVELIEGRVVHKGQWRAGGPVAYRFSPDQALQLVAGGIVTEEDAFALTEQGGEAKMPRSPGHDSAIERTDDALRPLLPAGWRLRIQCAVRLSGGEPEPDLAVVQGPVGRYDRQHPQPAEIATIVEVSDTSLAYDRTLKLRGYARSGIPVYWVVNLEDRQVEVYADPVSPPGADPHYQTRTDYRPGQQVPVTIAGTPVGQIAVDALLP